MENNLAHLNRAREKGPHWNATVYFVALKPLLGSDPSISLKVIISQKYLNENSTELYSLVQRTPRGSLEMV
jgi:hypothetical protein